MPACCETPLFSQVLSAASGALALHSPPFCHSIVPVVQLVLQPHFHNLAEHELSPTLFLAFFRTTISRITTLLFRTHLRASSKQQPRI